MYDEIYCSVYIVVIQGSGGWVKQSFLLLLLLRLRLVPSKSRKSGQTASLGSSLDVPSAVSVGKVFSFQRPDPVPPKGSPIRQLFPAIRPYNTSDIST